MSSAAAAEAAVTRADEKIVAAKIKCRYMSGLLMF
jgi:hypothetical protein